MANPPRSDLVLISCVESQQAWGDRVIESYNSPLWRARLAYARKHGTKALALSTKSGLVEPPDKGTGGRISLESQSPAARRAWAADILADLDREVDDLSDATITVLGNVAHCDYGLIEGLEARGAIVLRPTKHLKLGPQLSFLNAATRGG